MKPLSLTLTKTNSCLTVTLTRNSEMSWEGQCLCWKRSQRGKQNTHTHTHTHLYMRSLISRLKLTSTTLTAICGHKAVKSTSITLWFKCAVLVCPPLNLLPQTSWCHVSCVKTTSIKRFYPIRRFKGMHHCCFMSMSTLLWQEQVIGHQKMSHTNIYIHIWCFSTRHCSCKQEYCEESRCCHVLWRSTISGKSANKYLWPVSLN